jgi:hypothetical protein
VCGDRVLRSSGGVTKESNSRGENGAEWWFSLGADLSILGSVRRPVAFTTQRVAL